jgi:hypothetical protein
LPVDPTDTNCERRGQPFVNVWPGLDELLALTSALLDELLRRIAAL